MLLTPSNLREEVDEQALARHRKAIDQALGRYDKLEDAAVKRGLAILADSRRRILEELATLPDGGDDSFRADQLRRLRVAVEREAHDFARRYGTTLQDALGQAWDAGTALTPDTLEATGIKLTLNPEVSRAQLEMASQYTANVIHKLEAGLRDAVTHEIVTSALGGTSPREAMRRIAKLLGTPEGKFANQAETIYRTEMGTVYALANEVRQREVAAQVPGLRKYWLTAKDRRVRPDHVEAGKKYAPGGDPGPILQDETFRVGGETMRFPHDPAASAKQIVRCRCVAASWHPDWVEPSETEQPAEKPATGQPPTWKPQMTREEAEVWNADSVLRQPFYHGTNHADAVRQTGFRLENLGNRTSNGGVFGAGHYVSADSGYAGSYGSALLELRVNVKRPLNFLSTEPNDQRVVAKFSKLKQFLAGDLEEPAGNNQPGTVADLFADTTPEQAARYAQLADQKFGLQHAQRQMMIDHGYDAGIWALPDGKIMELNIFNDDGLVILRDE